MAEYELLLPKMGESVAEATIIKWVKKPGDIIRIDDEIVEIATDKVDSEVPSPVSGTLKKQVAKENEVVQVGGVIAIIETEDKINKPVAANAEKPVLTEKPAIDKIDEIPGLDQLNHLVEETTESTSGDPSYFYSPLVRSIAAEEGISMEELNLIKGTGTEGRITKQDLEDYIKNSGGKDIAAEKKEKAPAAKSKETPGSEKPAGSVQAETPKTKPVISVSGNDEIIEMDRMRRMISDHMVLSKQVSPHVNSFIEADVTNIVQWRERVKTDFEKRTGDKLTFTPIFIEAVAKAIKDFPMINISVSGTQIIKKRDINIGMATALPSGNLIVPVIKNADKLDLAKMAKTVNDLANRARNSKLLPDDVQDGTFTITNIGSFGNIMGTPIINQPQVAILAFGAIKKKPAVIETNSGDMIAIRHMMFLSMAYDHRVVDGALGGLFIKKVSDYLEDWDTGRKI